VLRDDYLGRMIRQLAEFIARVSGLALTRDFARADQELGRAWLELLDVPRELVDRVDGPTLAQLLRDPAKMRVAAELLVEEAWVRTSSGDRVHALQCSKRAFELFLEAHALDPQPTDDNAIFELGRVIPPNEIDPRYKS
jgi:hypothetical protein